jgi:hypothetical protein
LSTQTERKQRAHFAGMCCRLRAFCTFRALDGTWGFEPQTSTVSNLEPVRDDATPKKSESHERAVFMRFGRIFPALHLYPSDSTRLYPRRIVMRGYDTNYDTRNPLAGLAPGCAELSNRERVAATCIQVLFG